MSARRTARQAPARLVNALTALLILWLFAGQPLTHFFVRLFI